MTPEILWKLGRVGAQIISADGKNIIYSVRTYDMDANKGTSNFFSIPVGGGTPVAMNMTSGDGFMKAPDGKMAFISKGQLWEANWDGSAPAQISHTDGDMSVCKFSPDGKHILFCMEEHVGKTKDDYYPALSKSTARIYDDLMYRHWTDWEDGNYSHVFVADYADGVLSNTKDLMKDELYDCPQKPDGGAEDVTWSGDSKTITYVCKKKFGTAYAISTNTDIYFYDIATGTTTNFTEGMMGYDTNPNYNSDGSRVAWLSMEHDGYEADKNNLFVYDFATKSKYNITKDWDETVASILWSNDGSKIYFTADKNGSDEIFEVNLTNYFLKKDFIKRVTNGIWDVSSMVGQSGNNMIVTRTDMNHAAEIFSVDLSSGAMTQLTFTNKKAYDGISIGKIEQRWITTTDKKKMLTWVIYPPGFDSTKKYPALLYCQGGPQSTVSQFYSFRWNFQLMAANGYIVIAPCRRGMPGFGTQWNAEISKDWGGQAMQDYMSASDSISKLSFIDKSRIGCIGASYGGYSVYMLAGIANGRYKTYIAHCGLFDLESWYLTTEEMWFANWDIGGAFWQKYKPESYEKYDPKNFVQNWNTPIMIIEGEQDFRVPVTQGQEAFQAAQLKGIKSRLVYFPDEGHWIMQPQDGMLWQKEFYRWLKETL